MLFDIFCNNDITQREGMGHLQKCCFRRMLSTNRWNVWRSCINTFKGMTLFSGNSLWYQTKRKYHCFSWQLLLNHVHIEVMCVVDSPVSTLISDVITAWNAIIGEQTNIPTNTKTPTRRSVDPYICANESTSGRKACNERHIILIRGITSEVCHTSDLFQLESSQR